MKKFDILIVDIQDVGLRFYTYYISMVRLMDACAEYDRKILILDRPNPNGHYVDGPILDMKYKSGVGGLPIPIGTRNDTRRTCLDGQWRTMATLFTNLRRDRHSL